MSKTIPDYLKEEMEDEGIDVRTEEVKTIDNLNLDSETTFKLLGGYKDSDGIVHTTFTVREMTGRDEEAIGKPEVKANGSRLASTLLQRCVTSIGTLLPEKVGSIRWQEIIRGLYGADQDFILLKIRETSLGEEIEVNHVCPNPKCGAKLKTTVKTNEFEIDEFKGKHLVDFSLPTGYRDKKGVHKEGTLRLPTGLDREILTPAAKNNIAKAQTTMLTRLIKFNDGTPVDEDVLMDMTTRDREYLQKLLNDNAFGVQLTFDVTCDVCGTTFPGNLSSSNFI